MSIAFTPVLNAPDGTLVESNTVVISGLPVGTKLAQIIGDGEFTVNGTDWVTTSDVQNGTPVRLRVNTPPGELGQVTTVTISIPSLGYFEWRLTNKDNLIEEFGSGIDGVVAVTVSPGWLFDEIATAAVVIEGEQYIHMGEFGSGVDTSIPAITTGAVVSEFGKGSGVGFSAPSGVIEELGEGVDLVEGVVVTLVTELGSGADTVMPRVVATATVQDKASGRDSNLSQASVEIVGETGSGRDIVLSGLSYSDTVMDSAVGGDYVETQYTISATVGEAGDADGAALPSTTSRVNYNEIGYGFDEILMAYYTRGAWVFNARSMAMSRWEAMPITEVHEANGVVYGMSEEGIYVLSDTTASEAELESGLYDFGVIERKHLRHVYLTYTATEPINVGVVRSNAGGKQKIMYGKPAYDAETPTQTRINVGRGPLARYWGVTIVNTEGGFASIQDIRLVPDVTTRRI